MERITFVLTWIFQGPSYLSAYGYGIMHRMHHAYTDTEKDPHSPSHDANLFAMMWKTKTIYQDINEQRIEVDQKFTKNVPQWKAFDFFASSKLSRILWVSAYIFIFLHFCNYLVGMVIITCNSCDGTYTRRYNQLVRSYFWLCKLQGKNTSKNLLPFDFLMMGEGYHNNHHRYASRANFWSKMV